MPATTTAGALAWAVRFVSTRLCGSPRRLFEKVLLGFLSAFFLGISPALGLPIYQNALIELPCPPIAIADLDSDGNKDLILCGGDAVLGDGKGNFSVPFKLPLENCTLASDLNGDGNLDLACGGSTVNLLFGNGAGHYAEAIPLPFGGEPVAADFNSDGKTDIATSEGFLVIGDGQGTFGPTIPIGFAGDMRVGDFNRDGRADLLVLTRQPLTSLVILVGRGDGSFASHSVLENKHIPDARVGDINGDGATDIVFGETSFSYHVILGSPESDFHPTFNIPVLCEGTVFTLADFDGDGILDFAHASWSWAGGILRGRGDGSFERVVGLPKRNNSRFLGLLDGDLNGDGKSDLVHTIAEGFSPPVTKASVLISEGVGSFGLHILKGEIGLPAAVSDVDYNGLDDIAFLQPDPPYVTVFLSHESGDLEPRPVLWRSRTIAASLADMNLDHLPDLMVLDERGVGLSRALGDGRFSEPNYFDLPPQVGLRAINANNDGRTDVLTFSDEELCVLLATGEVVVEAPRCICPPSRNSALK